MTKITSERASKQKYMKRKKKERRTTQSIRRILLKTFADKMGTVSDSEVHCRLRKWNVGYFILSSSSSSFVFFVFFHSVVHSLQLNRFAGCVFIAATHVYISQMPFSRTQPLKLLLDVIIILVFIADVCHHSNIEEIDANWTLKTNENKIDKSRWRCCLSCAPLAAQFQMGINVISSGHISLPLATRHFLGWFCFTSIRHHASRLPFGYS